MYWQSNVNELAFSHCISLVRWEVITMYADIIFSIIEVAMNNQFFIAGGVFSTILVITLLMTIKK